MTDSIIERAARALAAHESGSDEWDAYDEPFKETIRKSVRVVMEAIREPTEDMLFAVHVGDAWNADDPEGIWLEMMDAALKDG